MVLENQATLAYRLSPIQEQVWAHQRASSALSYRVLCVVQLEGQLDASRLRDAIARTVVTHEILRTSYVRQPGMTAPFQVISASPNFAWEVVDAGKDVQFERLKTRAFDLEHGSVLSATLANINPEKHTLLLGLPAMAADTASLILLVKEIAREYSGEPAIAEDDLMQFVDVSEWQHELLQSEEAKPGREWWRDFWRSVDAAQFASLALPLEKHGGAFSPGSVPVALDSVLAARVEALAKRENKPLQHFLLTSWQILLSRITGRSDVVVGVTVDNRRHQELKRTLGPLSMNLPLRLQLDGGESFGQVLTQVSEISSEICMWQDSFSWAEAGEGLNHLPIRYEYMDLGEPIVAGDVGMEVAQLYSCTERFKVKLVVLRSPQGLGLELHLPAEARQRLLVEWNRTERAYPAGETMVSLFEVQAAKTPERTAVVAAGEQLTYSELNRRANQLAQALRAQGVAADAVVGLCLDRSVDLLVAILGILKAGGGYVPLNPDHPASRLEQQLSGVQVLVTQAQFLEKLPTHSRAVICLDRDQEMLAQQSASNPAALAGPENLVYVIYTSGSTGVPKGVEIEHRNLANYARFIAERLELENYPDGLRFATVSTIAADLGNTCIYPALIAGGTVHLISYEQATDAAQLGRYMQEHAIDVIKIVPSHLWALLASEEGGKVLPLKYLITGGEALTPRLLERLAQLEARCEVINHYGPTETTVGSVTLRLREAAGQKWDGSAIPLGRPIANTRVYILDGRLQPVPVGVMGELYIAGAGVGRGYRGQPQMTGERFLHDPFAADARARMYRTGDLARYLEDGNIEFLGRGDDQVKVRGFRIELGEIEAALAAHAAVKQAVVLAREDQETGEKRLLAYAVLQREKPATAEDLRQHLRAQLPDYMVPSAVILLDKLPLNANGKVDRQALPSVEEAGQAQQRAYLAPRTPVEEVVANIWAEVLRLPQVGADDNFFELGGHSLLATQVVSRLRRTLGVDLPLRALFEAPTAEKLAEKIATAQRSKEGLQAPPITSISRDGAIPLSFAQQRLWFLDQLQPNNPLYNIPRALRIRGRLNVAALAQSLNEIVRRHESQRTVFHSVRGEPVQVILPELAVPLPVVDLAGVSSGEQETEARRLAVEEAQRPFNLSEGPLLRATVLKLSEQDHILLLNTHHIVSDAWSAAIMLEELGVIYEAFVAGRPSPLPEPAIQYADYAVWQRNWLQGETLQKQLTYWRTALGGAPPVLELPTDRPRPGVRTFHGSYELLPLPQDLVEQCRVFSRKEGVTLFMTLMAAFHVLLARYSGQEQIIIGTDLASRTSVDTERLIGFFINVLPIRGNLSGDPPFRDFLIRMRDAALGAYAHQEMPLEKIVEELQPERSTSHSPLVQVLFVMQNTPRAQKKLADLTFDHFEIGVTPAKFDLAVFMIERPDGVLGSWLYSTDLFEAATIRRMAAHYENLLRSILAQPECRIGALEFMSEAEKQQRAREAEARKTSQLKKILIVQPKAVSLSQAQSANKD